MNTCDLCKVGLRKWRTVGSRTYDSVSPIKMAHFHDNGWFVAWCTSQVAQADEEARQVAEDEWLEEQMDSLGLIRGS